MKLAGLIQQMKAEIADVKHLAAAGRWEDAMALAGQRKAGGQGRLCPATGKKYHGAIIKEAP